MMKSIRTLVRQDREKYIIPRRVQDVIPIQKIWEDGIFLTGGRYAKTFRFTDINYQVASEPDKEKMFRGYSAIINSLDCGATTKITIFNHRMSQINFEKSMLSNSEFIVMLNQAASDREKLGRLLNISNEQMNYITNVEAGSGLIKYGSALVPFINRFPKNTKLYQLMTTRPNEKF